MARYIDSVCKLCRRERQKLFLKGQKCFTEKCPIESRNYPPGEHGQRRRSKVSEYGIQLREKQKIKRIYGLLETQFRNYFKKANKQLIRHRHFMINERLVDIPSYSLTAGDIIKVRDKSKKLDAIHNSMKRVKDTAYSWLTIDKANLTGTYVQIPEREDVPLNANEQLVVELYSK
jgi:small subunit ribosomal protein S4